MQWEQSKTPSLIIIKRLLTLRLEHLCRPRQQIMSTLQKKVPYGALWRRHNVEFANIDWWSSSSPGQLWAQSFQDHSGNHAVWFAVFTRANVRTVAWLFHVGTSEWQDWVLGEEEAVTHIKAAWVLLLCNFKSAHLYCWSFKIWCGDQHLRHSRRKTESSYTYYITRWPRTT